MRGRPERERERRDHEERREGGRIARVAVEPRVQRDRGDERDDAQRRVFEEAEREHAADRVPAAGAFAAERPVVDREASRAARCGEDAEAGDDRLRGDGEIHLRPAIDPGDIPDRQHVADVGERLTGEADAEPRPRMLRVDDAMDVRPARGGGEHVGDDDRRAGGGDNDRQRFFLEAEQPVAHCATGPDRQGSASLGAHRGSVAYPDPALPNRTFPVGEGGQNIPQLMPVLFLTIVALAAGGAMTLLMWRYPRQSRFARMPALASADKVGEVARRHSSVRHLLGRRLDPESATGLALSLALAVSSRAEPSSGSSPTSFARMRGCSRSTTALRSGASETPRRSRRTSSRGSRSSVRSMS